MHPLKSTNRFSQFSVPPYSYTSYYTSLAVEDGFGGDIVSVSAFSSTLKAVEWDYGKVTTPLNSTVRRNNA